MNSYYPNLELAEKIRKLHWTPAFVTSQKIIIERCKKFIDIIEWTKTKIFYAIKANFNPFIVSLIKNSWVHWIDAVSVMEVDYALKLWYEPWNIIFTWINITNEDLIYLWNKWVTINIWSLSELEKYGKNLPNSEVSLRLNPNIWEWRNEMVTTWWKNTKFWIDENNLKEAFEIIKKYNLKLIWLHCHIWSWFYDINKFLNAVDFILNEAKNISSLEFVDFWWGFWVPHSPKEKEFDIDLLLKILWEKLANHHKETWAELEMRLEPWSYLVEESTCLLATIVTIKESFWKIYVWLDTWLNHAPDPALYKMHHEVINISNLTWKKVLVSVVWNICESWDVFAENRELSEPREWDIVWILTVWWYSASSSSNYNMRPKATEVLIDEKDEISLMRKREKLEDIIWWYKYDF
jgi:diaminopimelate decarboxylase